MSNLDHNKGKTSSEVDLDTEPLILQIFCKIQALLEDYEEDLKDVSDKQMYEVGEEVDDEIPHTKEEPQPTEHYSPKPSKEKCSVIDNNHSYSFFLSNYLSDKLDLFVSYVEDLCMKDSSNDSTPIEHKDKYSSTLIHTIWKFVPSISSS
ncbi:hypothetical protein Tco_0286193 [Tanacetum coccineum]